MLVLHTTSHCWQCLQADKSRVKDYIHRLDNFDGPAVGEIAVGYEMFDEAFEIYKKFGLKTQAIRVLLDNHEDLERALEYATKVRFICRLQSGSSPRGYFEDTSGFWCLPGLSRVNLARSATGILTDGVPGMVMPVLKLS